MSVNELNTISVWYESAGHRLNDYSEHYIEATSHGGSVWSHRRLFNTSDDALLEPDSDGFSVQKVTQSTVSPHLAAISPGGYSTPFFTVGLSHAPYIEYKRTELGYGNSGFVLDSTYNVGAQLFYADDTVQMAWYHYGDEDSVVGGGPLAGPHIIRYGLRLREATLLSLIGLQQDRSYGTFLPCTADRVTGAFACLYQTNEGGPRAILVHDDDGSGAFGEVELGRSDEVGVAMGRQSLNLRNNVGSFVGATSNGTLHVTVWTIPGQF